MKTLSLFGISFLVFSQSWCQITTTLQPNSVDGKDAIIWYLSTQNGTFGATNSNPNPNADSFQAMEWTWGGSAGTRKSLIDFDISSIPLNSVITSARLSLYAFPNSPDGGHSPLSGSNACYLSEISSPWNENTVTWNTQPTINSANQVTLVQSTSELDDYLSFDVTAIIQNKYSNPTISHGFMLSIINSNYYRKMIFASSDHPDTNKHPKLEITYISTLDQEENIREPELSIYPNPSSDKFYLTLKSHFSYSVTDMIGRETIMETSGFEGLNEIDLSGKPRGAYLLKIHVQNTLFTRKIILE